MGEPNIQRNKIITVRVSEEENTLIRTLAKQNDLRLSDYLRLRALGGRITPPKLHKAQAQEIVQHLIKIEAELGHQGGNLNQMVKLGHILASEPLYNTEGALTQEEQIQALKAEYGRLREEVTKIWQRLQ